MRKLTFTHSSTLSLGTSVRDHFYTLRILPVDDAAQRVTVETCVVEPVEEHVLQRDGFGNVLYVGSCRSAHDTFSYRVHGSAVVDASRGRGGQCNVAYAFHSPLCMPGAALQRLHESAGAYAGADDAAAIRERAHALCAFVHAAMRYVPGATSVHTSAEQAAALGQGVCQDYAHVLCALLRMDGIAARYICGLMIGEGATHAWVEFHDGACWWGLDPTNECEAGDYHLVLARGRDHGDCPMESGVFKGGAMQRLVTQVHVQEASDEPQRP